MRIMYIEQYIETTILIHRELLRDFVSLLLEERKHSALEVRDLERLSSETATQTNKATENKSIKTGFQTCSFVFFLSIYHLNTNEKVLLLFYHVQFYCCEETL